MLSSDCYEYSSSLWEYDAGNSSARTETHQNHASPWKHESSPWKQDSLTLQLNYTGDTAASSDDSAAFGYDIKHVPRQQQQHQQRRFSLQHHQTVPGSGGSPWQPPKHTGRRLSLQHQSCGGYVQQLQPQPQSQPQPPPQQHPQRRFSLQHGGRSTTQFNPQRRFSMPQSGSWRSESTNPYDDDGYLGSDPLKRQQRGHRPRGCRGGRKNRKKKERAAAAAAAFGSEYGDVATDFDIEASPYSVTEYADFNSESPSMTPPRRRVLSFVLDSNTSGDEGNGGLALAAKDCSDHLHNDMITPHQGSQPYAFDALDAQRLHTTQHDTTPLPGTKLPIGGTVPLTPNLPRASDQDHESFLSLILPPFSLSESDASFKEGQAVLSTSSAHAIAAPMSRGELNSLSETMSHQNTSCSAIDESKQCESPWFYPIAREDDQNLTMKLDVSIAQTQLRNTRHCESVVDSFPDASTQGGHLSPSSPLVPPKKKHETGPDCLLINSPMIINQSSTRDSDSQPARLDFANDAVAKTISEFGSDDELAFNVASHSKKGRPLPSFPERSLDDEFRCRLEIDSILNAARASLDLNGGISDAGASLFAISPRSFLTGFKTITVLGDNSPTKISKVAV
jgi:hypothetical protein